MSKFNSYSSRIVNMNSPNGYSENLRDDESNEQSFSDKNNEEKFLDIIMEEGGKSSDIIMTEISSRADTPSDKFKSMV